MYRAAQSSQSQKCSTWRCCRRARTNGGPADSPGLVKRSVSTRNSFPSRSRRKGFEHCTLAHRLSIILPLRFCSARVNAAQWKRNLVALSLPEFAERHFSGISRRASSSSWMKTLECLPIGNLCRLVDEAIVEIVCVWFCCHPQVLMFSAQQLISIRTRNKMNRAGEKHDSLGLNCAVLCEFFRCVLQH